MFTGRVLKNFTPREKPKIVGCRTAAGDYRWLHISTNGVGVEYTEWAEALASVCGELTRRRVFGETSVYERKETPRARAA